MMHAPDLMDLFVTWCGHDRCGPVLMCVPAPKSVSFSRAPTLVLYTFARRWQVDAGSFSRVRGQRLGLGSLALFDVPVAGRAAEISCDERTHARCNEGARLAWGVIVPGWGGLQTLCGFLRDSTAQQAPQAREGAAAGLRLVPPGRRLEYQRRRAQ